VIFVYSHVFRSGGSSHERKHLLHTSLIIEQDFSQNYCHLCLGLGFAFTLPCGFLFCWYRGWI
jgi:hypothetical protein